MQKYNCYSILASVRRSLNEYSVAYVTGTDTSGKFNNDYLLEKINEAYRQLYAVLMPRIPSAFQAQTTITAVASVLTLPGDFGSLLLLRDSDGDQVFPVGYNDQTGGTREGTSREYYRVGNTLVINKPGETGTYTLFYKKRARNLEMGQAAAGSGAQDLRMATDANNSDDFYNGFYVENVTQDINVAITDYVGSSRSAVTGTLTWVAADWYGLVPEIPEFFHHLIAKRATVIVRAEFPLAQTPNNQETYQDFIGQIGDLLLSYGDMQGDIPYEEDLEDF